MSTFQSSHARPAAPHFMSTFVDAIAMTYATAMQFRQIRTDRRHLQEMPDHMLRDIGINRSEIDSVVGYRGRDESRRRRV